MCAPSSLKQVFQAAVQLIRIVQQAFVLRQSQNRLPAKGID